ncbi:MAG: tRNA (adenosine(37)-N6)-threonylcarbamoyltransferase complex transferase subunit TsaD [Acidobacteriota bacterium]
MRPVLGIETSCDDSSAAVVTEEGLLLSCVLAGQAEVHGPYGGVVPELASRAHLERLPSVVEGALAEAGTPLSAIGSVAVSSGPGLLGSLLVGLSYAKSLAWSLGIPVVGVNHIEAHLRSPWMEHPSLPYPALGLVVSGGHSHLFWCPGPDGPQLAAATRDDAAGEALDKVAKFLGLPYPGGPVIDRLSPRGNPRAFDLPLPRMSGGNGLDFSFSGLKTAALHRIREGGLVPAPAEDLDALPAWEYDLMASFQKRVVDHLLGRLKKAALRYRPASLVLAGGVACNRLLRERFKRLAEDLGLAAGLPSPRLCTDNAAMVAFRALDLLRKGPPAGYGLDATAVARWPGAR